MAKGWSSVSAGQLAALIAAGFFAVGMVAAVFVLLRLAGLISAARRVLTDYHDRASALLEQANSAVDRAHEQLARTDSITASMDEVTANMAELSGHVSALASLARGISAGFGAPLLRLSALTFGFRRALALRGTARRGVTQNGVTQRSAAQGSITQRSVTQRSAAQGSVTQPSAAQHPVALPQPGRGRR